MAERKSTLHRWELIALAAVAAVAVAVFLLDVYKRQVWGQLWISFYLEIKKK